MGNKVIRILMERDGLSFEQARALLIETREEMMDAIADGDYEIAEDIMYGNLGIEMDYITDIF